MEPNNQIKVYLYITEKVLHRGREMESTIMSAHTGEREGRKNI